MIRISPLPLHLHLFLSSPGDVMDERALAREVIVYTVRVKLRNEVTMPTYDYYCPANARTLEVRHRMSENLATWGELCAQAHVDLGDTPPDSPIQRLITGGNVISSTRSQAAPPPVMPCGQTQCSCAQRYNA